MRKQNKVIKEVGRQEWANELVNRRPMEKEWCSNSKVFSRYGTYKSSPELQSCSFGHVLAQCQSKARRCTGLFPSAGRAKDSGPFSKGCSLMTRDLLIHSINAFMPHFYICLAPPLPFTLIFLFFSVCLTPWLSLKGIKRTAYS